MKRTSAVRARDVDEATAITVVAAPEATAPEAQFVSRHMSKKDAALWVAASSTLRKKLGRPPAPSDFVAYARSRQGRAIHHLFDWNDAAAAEKWREHQAAYYCRMVNVVVAGDAPIRALLRVVDSDGSAGYVTAPEAAVNADYRRQVLGEAKRDAAALRLKYEALQRWLESEQLQVAIEAFRSAEAALG